MHGGAAIGDRDVVVAVSVEVAGRERPAVVGGARDGPHLVALKVFVYAVGRLVCVVIGMRSHQVAVAVVVDPVADLLGARKDRGEIGAAVAAVGGPVVVVVEGRILSAR